MKEERVEIKNDKGEVIAIARTEPNGNDGTSYYYEHIKGYNGEYEELEDGEIIYYEIHTWMDDDGHCITKMARGEIGIMNEGAITYEDTGWAEIRISDLYDGYVELDSSLCLKHTVEGYDFIDRLYHNIN